MFTTRELDEMAELVNELVLSNAKCTVRSPTEDFPEIDPNTLQPITTPGELKYDDICHVEPTTRINERAFDIGEVKQGTRTYTIRTKRTLVDCDINDVITVYESEDPMFQGAEFVVIDPQASTTPTQRIIIAQRSLGH